jgi:CubicO group peptidase (beta-lactamase class C family)
VKNLILASTMLMVITLVAGCAGPQAAPAPTVVPEPAYWPTAGWRTSTPEEQGMDSETLAQMFEDIAKKNLNIRSVLVVRNGYLVTEAYFHPYEQDTPIQIASVTKSFIGTLVGMAVDKGYIKSVDEPLLGFYEGRRLAQRDPNKEAVTLEHLLTMTSGFACTDGQMESSPNWVQFMLDLPMAKTPGATFNYCSGNPHLLSAILQKSTDMSAREFANSQLFAPLGIPAASAQSWGSDAQGIVTGGYGLHITPRDMLKLGYLYLNKGQWADERILSPAWVEAATTQHTTKVDGSGYGYLWTVYPDKGYYSALGLAGQHIHVVPGRNLVVVFTSGLNPSNGGDVAPLRDLLERYIIPAAKSSTALAANAKGLAHLEAQVRTAAHPVQPVPSLPAVAQSLSGKTYAIAENPWSWKTLSFTFQQGADAALVSADGSPLMPIGLDNLYRVTEMPESRPLMLRGRWENESDFVIDYPTLNAALGETSDYAIRLTFVGKEMDLTVQETVFGGTVVTMHGTLQD